MLAAKVKLKRAESIKKYLIKEEIYNKDYAILRTKNHIYFPISSENSIEKKFSDVQIVNKPLIKLAAKQSLKDAIKNKLTKTELSFLKRAFDVIGDIAIIEIPAKLTKKQKTIAQALLNQHKNIKVVLKKAGIHVGVFRTQKLKHLAGEKRKETIYRENGVQIKLDVEKVYFSPRLSTERKRIAGLIKKGEEILVMFSGCGIYPAVIAKNTEAKHITGIEINTVAHRYALENIRINKAANIDLINGDVKNIAPRMAQRYDRILMPLPKGAEDFLDLAIDLIKPKGTIHFYDFLAEEDFPGKSISKIDNACKKSEKKYKIISSVRCGQYSPRKYRVCIDFTIY